MQITYSHDELEVSRVVFYFNIFVDNFFIRRGVLRRRRRSAPPSAPALRNSIKRSASSVASAVLC